MEWIKIEDFRNKNYENLDSEFIVFIKSKGGKNNGFKKAYIAQGLLTVTSGVMNYYGTGFKITHFMHLQNPKH